jgi:hypothetical protein
MRKTPKDWFVVFMTSKRWLEIGKCIFDPSIDNNKVSYSQWKVKWELNSVLESDGDLQ